MKFSPLNPDSIEHRTSRTFMLGLLLVPLVLWGAWVAMGQMHNDVIQWTASGMDARHDYQWFSAHFESQDQVIVSWPGCNGEDRRLDAFAESVQKTIAADRQTGKETLFHEVTTGASLYQYLSGSPLKLPDDEAITRLRGTFLGVDSETICAVVALTSKGVSEGEEVERALRRAAELDAGVPAADVHLAGYVIQLAAINTASMSAMYWMSVPASLAVFAVAWVLLGGFRLAVTVCATAAFSQCLGLSLIPLRGDLMNGMLVVMPVLVFVVFVSAAVHLVNYFFDALDESSPREAAAAALRMGFAPCALAMTTTAIGIFSLTFSTIEPVRQFGAYSSVAVLLSLGVLIAFLPGALMWLFARHVPLRPEESKTLNRPDWLSRLWNRLALIACRWQLSIQFLALVAILLTTIGIGRVKTSMILRDFFRDDSSIVQDYRWLEEHIGPLFPTEIVLRFGEQCELNMHDRLQLVRKVEDRIATGPLGAVTLSAGTFTVDPAPERGWRATVQRTLINRSLIRHRAELIEQKYLADSDGEELWRVTVRLSALADRRYGDLVKQLQESVDQVLVEARADGVQGVRVTMTGMLPLVASSQWELIRGLLVSFCASMGLITFTLIIGLGDLRLGLLSIIPNAFPIVVVFGTVGWLGEAIDVGSMMTASVGFGIAVDDTVHFLTWFKRGLQSGFSRPRAVIFAYQRCATAMLRTTIICGAGLLPFAATSFGPAARFGSTICLLLVVALVGDLLLLPALLVGPIGKRLFPVKREPQTAPTR